MNNTERKYGKMACFSAEPTDADSRGTAYMLACLHEADVRAWRATRVLP